MGRHRQNRGHAGMPGTSGAGQTRQLRRHDREPGKVGGAEENRPRPGQILQRRSHPGKAGGTPESRGHSGKPRSESGGGRGLSRRVGGIISPGGFRGGAPGAPTCPPSSHHKCFFLRDDDGMPSSSRYLATVRRAILTPRPSLRRELMSSSDRGWDWSSPSMRARMRALTLSEPT